MWAEPRQRLAIHDVNCSSNFISLEAEPSRDSFARQRASPWPKDKLRAETSREEHKTPPRGLSNVRTGDGPDANLVGTATAFRAELAGAVKASRTHGQLPSAEAEFADGRRALSFVFATIPVSSSRPPRFHSRAAAPRYDRRKLHSTVRSQPLWHKSGSRLAADVQASRHFSFWREKHMVVGGRIC